MKREFIVEVYELHAQQYRVKADSVEEAKEAIENGEGSEDGDTEYISVADLYQGKDMPPGIRSVRERGSR